MYIRRYHVIRLPLTARMIRILPIYHEACNLLWNVEALSDCNKSENNAYSDKYSVTKVTTRMGENGRGRGVTMAEEGGEDGRGRGVKMAEEGGEYGRGRGVMMAEEGGDDG